MINLLNFHRVALNNDCSSESDLELVAFEGTNDEENRNRDIDF